MPRQHRRENWNPIIIPCVTSARPLNTLIPPCKLSKRPLQIPKGVTRPPVVINWGGVDSWKEDRVRTVNRMMSAGLAVLSVDMPGTGENPLLYNDPLGPKTYLTWIDYLNTRADIDGSRIGAWA